MGTIHFRRSCVLLLGLAACFLTTSAIGAEKLKALIVDGQNNHAVWPKTTTMMKAYLEETGLFAVDVATTAPQGVDADFRPEFSKYDVVVSNYNGADWPKETQEAFVEYMKNGGGLVIVHAANNAFGNWDEYNRIIGLGGWGGRNETSGPYVYLAEDGKVVRDKSKGGGGHHGPQHPFAIVVRDTEHPVPRACPANGCTPRMSFTTSSEAPRPTCGSWRRPMPTPPRVERAGTSR